MAVGSRKNGDRMARNVALNIAYNTLSQLSQSIMQRQVLAEYMEVLTGSDSVVGYVSAVSGVAMLLCAFPVGYLTDKFPRAFMLKASCITGLLAAVLLILAVLLSDIRVMYVTSAVFGAANAMTSAPLMSILADSVESGGKRTSIFIIQYALGLLASAVGPLIALVMFWRISAEWDISILCIILHSGNALNIATTMLLWWFDDTESALTIVEHAHAPLVASAASLQVGSDKSAFARVRTRDNMNEENTPLLGTTLAEQETHEAVLRKRNLGHQTCNLGCVRLTTAWIPYIIFTSDMIMSLGAGMTVQFFPLFFKNDFSLGPVPVAAIFAVTPVAIALFAMCAIPLNKRLGRATTAVLLDAAGTATLFSMSLQSNSMWTDVILFQVRTAALNAGYPTQRAILMDVVPKSHRGKWNALESVTTFTWTGSAALGGLLITTHDYRFTFMITGILYVVATMLLALLIPLTRGERVEDVAGPRTVKTVLVKNSAQAAAQVPEDLLSRTYTPLYHQISPPA